MSNGGVAPGGADMAKTREELDSILDELESELPELLKDTEALPSLREGRCSCPGSVRRLATTGSTKGGTPHKEDVRDGL